MGKAECRFYSNFSLGWVYPRIRRRMQIVNVLVSLGFLHRRSKRKRREGEIKRVNMRDNFCISTEWFQEPDGRIISPLLFFLWSTYWQFSLSDHVKRPSRFHRSMFFLTWKILRVLRKNEIILLIDSYCKINYCKITYDWRSFLVFGFWSDSRKYTVIMCWYCSIFIL